MPTIIDVAKRAGVSKSTISRYLNNKPIRKENKVKIEKAIKELNYHINPIARSLKTSKSYTIGVVITDITDLFVTYIIQACEQTLNNKGYSIILCDSHGDLELEKDRLTFLYNKRVDGIIVQPCSDEGEHIKNIIANGTPVVLIDRMIEGIDCDCVMADNLGGAYIGVKNLIERGHRDIGIIRGPHSIYTARERLEGYKMALRDHKINIKEDYIINGGFNKEGGKKALVHIMGMKNRPTAVFVSNYFMTIGVIEAILEYEYHIPEDISIIVFDNLKANNAMDWSVVTNPTFSTITQPIGTIGQKAGELIIQAMEKDMRDIDEPNVIRLATKLDLTESIAYMTI